ncbi:zinc ribbon domain-containing protein [Limosilactobacillus fermentum]|uniref:zinc ribbon domain-containing protein n=1 Tax=Limosilactobacillus fermentum TaxID=1613 RepID=UPI001E60BDE9|nr:zinc ribbon domain-containing protein [Limosilactobacillus fermentum]MCC6111687.1 zinc ribbon domain-containing protein [Limosilactobacillus fermentum]
MICNHCGTQNDATAKFCIYCGHALIGPESAPKQEAHSTNQCPNCGTENTPSAKYCVSCGHALTPSKHVQDSQTTTTQASTKSRSTARNTSSPNTSSHSYFLLKLVIVVAILIFAIPKGYAYIQQAMIPKGSADYDTIIDHVTKHDGQDIIILQMRDLLNQATVNESPSVFIEKNKDTGRYIFPIKIAKKKTYCYVVKVIEQFYADGSYKYSYVAVSLDKNKKNKYENKILDPNHFEKEFHQKDAYGYTADELPN